MNANRFSRDDADDSDFEDEDDFMEGGAESEFTERRRRELQEMAIKAATTYGSYDLVPAEKELFAITTAAPKVVVHFAHKEFKRCLIMDKHLSAIARKHVETRFVKIDVQNAPFLVEKLKIQILPCLVSFINGVTIDRLLGFEGVTEKDEFPTHMLEKRLASVKVISLSDNIRAPVSIFGFEEKQGAYESDDDWD